MELSALGTIFLLVNKMLMFKKNLKKFSLLFALIFIFLIISFPLFDLNAGNTSINNPLTSNSFADLFGKIADWVAGIVALVAVLMIVYGGVQYMISGGNEEKTTAARKTVQWALIGLLIVGLSWSLANELIEILGV